MEIVSSNPFFQLDHSLIWIIAGTAIRTSTVTCARLKEPRYLNRYNPLPVEPVTLARLNSSLLPVPV